MKKFYQKIEVVMADFGEEDVLIRSDSSNGVASDLEWLTQGDSINMGGGI